MYRIAKILTAEEIQAIQNTLSDNALFQDGRLSAGWHARAVKNNQQAEVAAVKGPLAKIERALKSNRMFQAAAIPHRLISLRINRYGPGQYYGRHTDDAMIDGSRTDLSFTIFLSDPKSYRGGDLVIENSDGETRVKLDAGDMILYPATVLHRVDAVDSGERLAAVGWVRSLVRNADRRRILFDLATVMQQTFELEGKTERFDLIAQTRSNLLRMWAQD